MCPYMTHLHPQATHATEQWLPFRVKLDWETAADSIIKKGTQVTAVGLTTEAGAEINGREGAVHQQKTLFRTVSPCFSSIPYAAPHTTCALLRTVYPSTQVPRLGAAF